MTADIAAGGYQWNLVDHGGDGKPALVLLHGFTGCADVWDEIVADLHDEFRCIAVDLPGHGATRCPDSVDRYRLPAVVDGLAELFGVIGVLPFVLWGYSMGGRLALQYALRHPTSLTHLILESASPGIADPVERAQRRERDNALADHIEEVGINRFADEWAQNPIFAGQRSLPEAKQERMKTLRRRGNARGLALSLRNMGTGAQEPLHAELAVLQTPTLIMVGEEDQKFRGIGEDMNTQIARSELLCIKGAGHSPYWEQPARAVSAVRGFIERTMPHPG